MQKTHTVNIQMQLVL